MTRELKNTEKRKKRHEKNINLMNFLEAHNYIVSKGMSPDRKYIEYLKVGYEEIPDQTEHTPKLAKS